MTLHIQQMEHQVSGLTNLQRDIYEKLDSLVAGVSDGPASFVPAVSTSSLYNGSHPPISHLATTPLPSNQTTPSDRASETATDSVDLSNVITVQLTDDPFTFHKSKAQPPPAQRFLKDIMSLFHEWESSNLLQIDGRGILMKDWDRIYKQWVGLFQQS